jgi:hypothetical protein
MARDELPLEWIGFEQEVQRRVRRFTYPPTPNLGPRLADAMLPWREQRAALRRRLAWALLALLVIVAGLAAVEPVRAWVAEILRLGAVRIISPAPQPTRTPIPVHLGWGGQTSLAEAAAELPFAVQLPTQPADLGMPHAAYLQDLNGPALLLVWMDPAQPRRVRLTLHALSSEALAYKMDPPTVEETEVNGQPALWTTGPYIVALRSGEWVAERLVAGHVLIWSADDVTYRLESDLSLAEAVAIAESLQPWQQP